MSTTNLNKSLFFLIDDKHSPNLLALNLHKMTPMIEVIKSIAAMVTVMLIGRPRLQEAL